MVTTGTMFGSREDFIFQDGRDSSKLMAEGKEPSERSEFRREQWQLMELVQREARGMVQWMSNSGTETEIAHPLRPQDGQGQWDRQGYFKPIWCLFENERKVSLLSGRKQKDRSMALQVENRLDFSSQSALV